jgi:hypothetical protein
MHLDIKETVWTLAILNVIFIIVFVWLTHTTIFDQWLTNKVMPNLCTEQQPDGQVVFTFCEEDLDE